MACVSDIDLATLHRNRLEERVHYKLSWWARRMICDTKKHLKERRHTGMVGNGKPQHKHPHHTDKPPTEAVQGRRNGDRYRDLVRNSGQQHGQDGVLSADMISVQQDLDHRLNKNQYKEEEYFTTERRWRSGTWP